MRLSDIHVPTSFECCVTPKSNSEALELQNAKTPQMGTLQCGQYAHEYILHLGKYFMSAALRDRAVANDLNFYLKRGSAHLIEIKSIAADNQLLVYIVFFNGTLIELGQVEIALDEHIQDTAKKNGIKAKTIEILAEDLVKRTVLHVGDYQYFTITAGAASARDFSDQDEDSKENKLVNWGMSAYPAFSIYGAQVRIPVEKRKLSSDIGDEIYFAKKLITQDRQQQDGAIRLVRGNILFQDYTKTGKIRALAAGAMQRLIQEEGSYLKKWDEYGAIEGEMLLERARAIGRIDYDLTAVEQLNGKVKFLNLNLPQGLSEGDTLDIVEYEPLYLAKLDMDWEEYSDIFTQNSSQRNSRKNKTPRDESEDESGTETKPLDTVKILELSEKSLVLDLPVTPEKGYFFTLSIEGDKVQIMRRMRARAAILEGRSANPSLGLLIEDNGILPQVQRVTQKKPLTTFVKNKIFEHAPTPKQVDAIDIALNTPDIALIQGPPGTGKTTVITAILERLNEEHDKSRSVRGEILVSGVQHDAVENVISRLSINNVPPVKYGKRSSDNEFSASAVSQKINVWCQNLADKIRSKNPDIKQSEAQRQLFELFATYVLSSSQLHAKNLLSRIVALSPQEVSMDLRQRAHEILSDLDQQDIPYNASNLQIIRGLRVTQEGFLDDGADRACDVLDAFELYPNENNQKALKKAACWQPNQPLNFLGELNQIKKELLIQFSPRPEFRQAKPRVDILELIAQVSNKLESGQLQQNKHTVILADFLHELEHNPAAARIAIEEYNFVFAATVQQAEGRDIRLAKKKNFNDDLLHYDTVIIDEAARTSPRDLLIPMSQARKRIILVGDHRQLPHIIDEEIARQLESDVAEDKHQDFIQKSMFEYLFHRLKKLEGQDGIKRTVTLDAQYRTHPVLGNFASQNFYEAYNEGYTSPLAAENFFQNLAHTDGKPALWIRVPYQQGNESKTGTSRKRDAEARKIAQQIKEWIDSDEGKTLSFCVISFYKAQVNAVFKELSVYGITERTSDGRWQCTEPYRLLQKERKGKITIEDRLRIGTVDAFQGMEFDVVILSMVRTQKNLEFNHMDEKKQRSVFGHLMSENRLCVSMTRQKRVLAVIGDEALIQTPLAKKAVPALSNYYQLCVEQGAVL